MKRLAGIAKGVKAVVAAVAVAATAIALLAFVLSRIGLPAWAGPLLSEWYLPSLSIASVVLAVLFYRHFDR